MTEEPQTAGSIAALGGVSATMMLGGALGFGAQVLIGRTLGPSAFGGFASTYSWTTLLWPLAGCGLGQFWLRVSSLEGKAATRWLPGLWKVLTQGILWGGLIASVTALLIFRQAVAFEMALAFTPVIAIYALTDVTVAAFQADRRFGKVASWQVSPNVARFIAGAVIFTLGLRAVPAAFTLGAFSVGGTLLLAGAFRRSTSEGVPTHDSLNVLSKPSALDVAKTAWPYAISRFFYLINFQLDQVLVLAFVGSAQAGLYRSSTAFLFGAFLLSSAIVGRYVVPHYHQLAAKAPERLVATIRRTQTGMLLAAVLVGGTIYVLGPALLRGLFGHSYEGATQILRVLSLAIPFKYLSFSATSALVEFANAVLRVRLEAATAVANLVLNLALIPRYGALGAGWATVASEAILFGLSIYATRSAFGARARSSDT